MRLAKGNSNFRLANRAWTPALLSIRPSLWLDGKDLSTITTSGGVVSQWNDKSGNGRHASQATAGSRPSIVTKGLRFDGVDDTLKTASFVLSQPFSRVSVLAKRNASATAQHYLNTTTGTPNTALFNNSAAGTVSMAAGTVAPTVNFANGKTSIFVEQFNGASSTLWQDGVGTTGNPGANGLDGVTIASSGAGAGFAQIDVFAVLVIPAILGGWDRQRLEGWLAWQYGLAANLPAGHPFRNKPPLNGA